MHNDFLVLVLQSLVLFPNQEVKLELSSKVSKNIIYKAVNDKKSEVVIISPKDELEIRPSIKDLPNIGTLASIKNNIILPNGNVRVTLRGIKRVHINKMYTVDEMIFSVTSNINNTLYNLQEEKEYIRKLKKIVNEYVTLSSSTSNSINEIIKNITSLSKLTDIVSASLDLEYKNKLSLLIEVNHYKRAHRLITLICSEISSFEFDKKIENEIQEKFKKNERDYLIKEKINLLSRELDSSLDISKEIEEYNKKIDSFKIDKKVKTNLKREVKRLSSTVETSPEFGVIRAHLDFVTNLPWNKKTIDKKDIKEIDRRINQTHYGLNLAKTRIEEYLILKSKNKNLQSPILCLIGPPGTGKTTFARELAASIGREFIKISVGGLNDSAELIGHRRTYIGACPGKIMDGLRKCAVSNPIILIDEVDKMIKDYKGDPASVLLEILDQNQNKEFIDNYVGEPFDLSNVLFILTANNESDIPTPLIDRLEVIDVHSYTILDKIEIAKNYTLPRLGKEYNFDYKKIVLTDKAIIKIVNEYTKEAGVRDLERHISSIVRKVLIKNIKKKVIIGEKDIPKYLGVNKYSHYINSYTTCGSVNVPAFNNYGGIVINIECVIYDGKDEIITTGSLGEVMKESILIAISYIKSNAKKMKIDIRKLKGCIHIHALDGASFKDGPSAGLGIAVSIISNILNKKVPIDLAFTGEISLEGRILKIGGLKEKIISCYNQGIKKIFIPMENIGDLSEIPEEVLNEISIVPINDFTEVYGTIFN